MAKRMVVVASSVADLQKKHGKAGAVSIEEGKSGSTKVSERQGEHIYDRVLRASKV